MARLRSLVLLFLSLSPHHPSLPFPHPPSLHQAAVPPAPQPLWKQRTPRLAFTSCRCRANMAHIRQSALDYSLGFEVRVLKTFKLIPSRSAVVARKCRASPHHRRKKALTATLTLERQAPGTALRTQGTHCEAQTLPPSPTICMTPVLRLLFAPRSRRNKSERKCSEDGSRTNLATSPHGGLRGFRSFEMSNVTWPNLHHIRPSSPFREANRHLMKGS